MPSVRFERDALRQVLFNLVDNALKYSREASERRISVRLEPQHADRVLLFVRDRGPGVHKEHLRAIFQPFFRAERELTRKTQGTGIGLSLVQGLVRAHGGRRAVRQRRTGTRDPDRVRRGLGPSNGALVAALNG